MEYWWGFFSFNNREQITTTSRGKAKNKTDDETTFFIPGSPQLPVTSGIVSQRGSELKSAVWLSLLNGGRALVCEI
jgi:hypothetical protein